MTQHSKTEPTNTTETNGGNGVSGYTEVSNSSGPIDLYTATGPFCWSIDAYVDRVGPSVEQWFITLHVTAQGGDNQRIFKSETRQVVPNTSILIPFPTNTVSPIAKSSYGMPTIEARFHDGDIIVPDCIGVMFTLDSTGHPVVKIIDTDIASTWIIGAREIVLTDPPLTA